MAEEEKPFDKIKKGLKKVVVGSADVVGGAVDVVGGTVEGVKKVVEVTKERVEDTAEDVKEVETARELTDSDPSRSYKVRENIEYDVKEGMEPMNPDDMASHEPTAVKRDKKEGTSEDPV